MVAGAGGQEAASGAVTGRRGEGSSRIYEKCIYIEILESAAEGTVVFRVSCRPAASCPAPCSAVFVSARGPRPVSGRPRAKARHPPRSPSSHLCGRPGHGEHDVQRHVELLGAVRVAVRGRVGHDGVGHKGHIGVLRIRQCACAPRAEQDLLDLGGGRVGGSGSGERGGRGEAVRTRCTRLLYRIASPGIQRRRGGIT